MSERGSEGEERYHVIGLEDLTLIACTVAVHSEGRRLLLEVLLRKGDASADGDLGADDAVASKEGLGEDVHRAALAVGHARLAAEKLREYTGDGAAAQHCEGMAAVGGDDTVLGGDTVFQADRDSFLGDVQ